MLMIIGGHIIMNHRNVYDFHNMNFPISLFLKGSFAVAVNAFVLISGYWGIRFKWSRLLKIDMQTVFYSIVLLVVAIMLGWHTIDFRYDFLLLFPVLFKQYWFITCYVVLYLISPLLNQWSKSLEKNRYKSLLVYGALIVYLWPTINFLFNASQFIDDAGYGIINFIYLYMLGMYLSHHYVDRYSVWTYWTGYVISVVLLFFAQYGLSWILGFEFSSWISYNTMFVFVGSLCLFLVFKNMHFSSSWVNTVAKPCFAVYLIHLHPCVWKHFCEAISVSSYHGCQYILLIVFLPFVIYAICAFLESVRVMLLGKVEDSLSVFVERRIMKQS